MPHDQFDYLKVGQLLLIFLISMNENGQHENRFYEPILIICHIFYRKQNVMRSKRDLIVLDLFLDGNMSKDPSEVIYMIEPTVLYSLIPNSYQSTM